MFCTKQIHHPKLTETTMMIGCKIASNKIKFMARATFGKGPQVYTQNGLK